MGKKADLQGQKFGRLTVLCDSGSRDSSGSVLWMCQCECGNTALCSTHDLNRGGTKSCGCLQRELAKSIGAITGGRNLIDLTGKKFGRLTVVKRADNDKNGSPRWQCKCDCGKFVSVYGSSLRSGETQSCGCLNREISSKKNKTHGLSKTKLYSVWTDMKDRCFNPRNHAYMYYGQRGISVCPEWKNDFMAFFTWAINAGYADGLSIDRIDVDGNYEPNNCRWATWVIQNNNKRDNIKYKLYMKD